MELEGRRVAVGEYAGPCPFKGIGDDRFHWWPQEDLWWCRNPDGCIDCPGVPSKNSPGTFWGNISYEHTRHKLIIPQAVQNTPKMHRPPPPTMKQVLEFHRRLDEETIQYLRDRGIYYETALKFLVGRNQTRLTVPLIAGGKCWGIKKRWIGKPPEGVPKYVFVPGSRGKSLFNWDRLTARRHWDYIVVTKAPLDAMLLEQLGIPAVGPFGGESVWDSRWTPYLDRADVVVNVGDNDDEGIRWVERRQSLLGRNSVLAFPPEGKDPTEAYLRGVDLHEWIKQTLSVVR